MNEINLKLTSRLYRDESDLRTMLELLMRARQHTDDWRYPHLGELMWNFFMVLIHLDPCRHIRLWHAPDGRLMAYAMLGEDPTFDWQVLPGFEWSGIEVQAFSWAESLVEQLRQADPPTWSGPLNAVARRTDALRIDFLERHGFRYQGKFAEVNMLCKLDHALRDLPIPAGYQVRALLPEELPERAAVERDVWQPWSVGNVRNDDYPRLTALPGYLPELEVATFTPDGKIASQVTGWIDPINRIGDLGPVGARPEYRRQGLTRLALLETMRRMQHLGMDRVCISTTFTNTPALNLYKSIGFTEVTRTLDYVQEG